MCNFSFYFAYVIFCHAIFNGIECYHGFPFLFLDLKSSLENFSQLLASRGNDWGCTFVDRRKRTKDHIRVSGIRGTQKTSDHHGRNLGKPFLWVNRIGHLDQSFCPVFVLIAQSLFFSTATLIYENNTVINISCGNQYSLLTVNFMAITKWNWVGKERRWRRKRRLGTNHAGSCRPRSDVGLNFKCDRKPLKNFRQ